MSSDGRKTEVKPAGESWRAALGHGDLVAMAAYGGTLWAELSQNAPPPTDLLTQVASRLAPQVSVLEMPRVDGTLVWMVTQETAGSGIGSLARIGSWSKGKTAAVGSLAVSRADGVPGLKGVYGAQFEVVEVEDPVERASRLTGGEVAIAAFRRSERTGATGLVELVDTEKLALADPGVVLVNNAFTEAEPERVLSIDQMAKALDTKALIGLEAEVAAGGNVAEVTSRWLASQGVA